MSSHNPRRPRQFMFLTVGGAFTSLMIGYWKLTEEPFFLVIALLMVITTIYGMIIA